MTARFIVADVFDGLATLEDGTVDLVVTSPPFLALRSYLPADHPDKGKEIGSEATPAEFLDVLLAVTAELRRVLAPHGSICVELGDTYAGSGGAGGDYLPGGWRDSQQRFDGSGVKERGEVPADGLTAAPTPLGTRSPLPDSEAKYGGGRPRARSGGGAYDAFKGGGPGGDGWPLAKSKTLIPELYRIALAYGINPLTGQKSPAGRWRVRNNVTWCRPNPPVGALGDKWRPATSDVVIACTSDKRYWDDIATRRPHLVNPEQRRPQTPTKRTERQDLAPHAGFGLAGSPGRDGFINEGNPAGAPLLDYWEIPPGGYSGKTLTTHREPCGPHDGGQRTTSPDCPLHGDRPGQVPTAPHDGRAGTSPSRTSRTDADPVQGQLVDSSPTGPNNEHSTARSNSDSPDQGRSPVATLHNTASSKTDPAPETNPPDTPSVETTPHTDGKPASPESGGRHPDISDHNISEGGSGGSPGPENTGRTADIDRQQESSEACTCSYSKVVKEEYTSHYAVFPPALVEPLIKAMAPPKICRQCGEPTRRITKEEPNKEGRLALAHHIKNQRLALGIQRKTVNAWFGYEAGIQHWEATDDNNNAVPTPDDWAVLKDRLDLSSSFDELIEGDRRWTELAMTDEYAQFRAENGPRQSKSDAAAQGAMAKIGPSTTAGHKTLGWSDCGHDDPRPALILDPFAGSGTTLSVATGHGHDAVGIDLDPRNMELARDRVGPLWFDEVML